MKLIFGVLLLVAALAGLGSVLAGVSIRRVIDTYLIVALGVVGAVLAGVAFGDFAWQLDVLGQFLMLTPIAAAIILGICLATRRKVIAANSAVALALASLLAVPWAMNPPSPPTDAPSFSLLLFNVWSKNRRPVEVRELVRKTDADVVVLIEMTPRVSAALGDFADLYPYRYECVGTEDCDILILAKTKFDGARAERLRDDANSYVASTRMTIDGCDLTLLATHMDHPGPGQLLQAHEIAGVVSNLSGESMLVGDFNGVPWGANVQTILKGAHLSIAEGLGGTFPSGLISLFALPIDHALTSAGVAVTERRVMPPAGSDHLPVLLKVTFVGRSACDSQPNS